MSHDPAKRRFFTLQLVRLGGWVIAMIGLAALTGKIALPRPITALLILIGLYGLFAVPIILAKRWKSPPQ